MDIDIDVKSRNELLPKLRHIHASMLEGGRLKKHPVGIYGQNIPVCPITGISSLPYEIAEEFGYVKIDILNNHVYDLIRDEEHLNELLNKEPNWSLLEDENFASKLVHIHKHTKLLKKFKPKNIDELAAFLALIRPAKSHLRRLEKSEIMKRIWDKNDVSEGYLFKKSHAYAYAFLIAIQMNILCEGSEGRE